MPEAPNSAKVVIEGHTQTYLLLRACLLCGMSKQNLQQVVGCSWRTIKHWIETDLELSDLFVHRTSIINSKWTCQYCKKDGISGPGGMSSHLRGCPFLVAYKCVGCGVELSRRYTAGRRQKTHRCASCRRDYDHYLYYEVPPVQDEKYFKVVEFVRNSRETSLERMASLMKLDRTYVTRVVRHSGIRSVHLGRPGPRYQAVRTCRLCAVERVDHLSRRRKLCSKCLPVFLESQRSTKESREAHRLNDNEASKIRYYQQREQQIDKTRRNKAVRKYGLDKDRWREQWDFIRGLARVRAPSGGWQRPRDWRQIWEIERGIKCKNGI